MAKFVRTDISIHAPRRGSDAPSAATPQAEAKFQSTLPVGGATHPPQLQQVSGHISIHAPRIGSDSRINSTASSSCYFNPRSPHGERRIPSRTRTGIVIFQSTLPAWGATVVLANQASASKISIHAPRMGSDHTAIAPPRGLVISIHAPRMGSDLRSRPHPCG